MNIGPEDTVDPDSNEARLAAHRRLHNLGIPPHPEVVARNQWSSLMFLQRNEAIGHLQSILNDRRTATQALESDRAAREWLRSIGSEPT